MSPLKTSNSRQSSTAPVVKSGGSGHGLERPAMQTRRQQRRPHLLASVPGSVSFQRAKGRVGRKQALQKLEIPETASLGGSGLTTPFGTRWPTVGSDPLTPMTAIASPSHVMILIVAVPAIWKQANFGREGTCTSTGGPHWMADYRHHHHPCQPGICGESSRSQTDKKIQKIHQDLWKHGPKIFGRPFDADVFVRAIQLPQSLLGEERQTSEKGKGKSTVSLSLVPPAGQLTMRAVLHSKQRAAVVLTRQFELEKLQATLPAEPLPSPHSPNFDREALFSALRMSSDSFSRANGSYLSSRDVKIEPGEEPSFDHEDLLNTAIPMHFPYARANLPALAAIMMSNRIAPGDVVDLAVPHPEVWSETVAYVYTGERELLTEPVRGNILYLGGRV